MRKESYSNKLLHAEAFLVEECFFAMPFTSLLDLKPPVHPIPNNLNAFAARSPSNFHYIAMLYAYILVLINTFITILDTIVCVEPGSIQVCFQSYPLRRVCS